MAHHAHARRGWSTRGFNAPLSGMLFAMEELQHISGRLTTRVAASNEKTPGPASREKLCKLCSDLRKPTNERFIFLGGGFSFRDLYFQPLVGKNDPTDFKFPSRNHHPDCFWLSFHQEAFVGLHLGEHRAFSWCLCWGPRMLKHSLGAWL